MIFGPAYKGIPLGSAIAIAFADLYARDVPYCFNRKEAKDHGEGGVCFGAALQGRVLIVDDVISAGTSVAEAIAIIQAAKAEPTGVAISLNRQERGQDLLSAVDEVEQRHGIPVVSVVRVDDIIDYLRESGGYDTEINEISAYIARYGA